MGKTAVSEGMGLGELQPARIAHAHLDNGSEADASVASAYPENSVHPANRRAQNLDAPKRLKERVRKCFLGLSLALLFVFATQLLISDNEPVFEFLTVAALVWLACRWIQTYRKPASSPLWDVAEGFMLGTTGVMLDGLITPFGLVFIGLLYSALVFRALDSSPQRVFIGVLVYYLACLGTLASSPMVFLDNPLWVATIIAAPGLGVLAVVAYTLSLVVTRHVSDTAHQQLLLNSGNELITAADVAQVAELTIDTARRLVPVDQNQNPSVKLLSGTPEALTIFGDQDESSADPLRTVGFDVLPASVRGDLANGTTVRSDDMNALESLQLGSRSSNAVLIPLRPEDELLGLLVVATSGRLSQETVDGLELLAAQVADTLVRVQLADELQQREALFRSLVHSSSDIIAVIDAEVRITFHTPNLAKLLGSESVDLQEMRVTDLIHPDDRASVMEFIEAVTEHSRDTRTAEWRFQSFAGEVIPVEAVATDMLNQAGIEGVVLQCRDVSERKLREIQLVHNAFHDPLTQLANRAQFKERVEHALARPFNRTCSMAVLLLDLDRFKTVNDSLGHEAGDQLLVTVADRLRECVRPSDTVARLGGDEFAILIDNIIDEVQATEIAERILERMQERTYIAGHELVVTTSIGIALGSAQRDLLDDLLSRADLAMYAAKQEGKACYRVYEPSMRVGAIERLDLETALHFAVQRRELAVHYQPQIDLRTGRINEIEALVRWNHPSRGLLMPTQFIPMAEETGLILPTGKWVLEEASREARRWQDMNRGEAPITLCVNLSVRQFQEPNIVDAVASILEEAGLPPERLKLEITESIAFPDIEAGLTTLHELRSLGVQLAIDDFGTGYSALSVLSQLPVNTLKIDRSFIVALGQDESSTAVVSAMINFAKAMGLSVTAEGVETKEQFAHLRRLRCDYGQGYLFAPPVPADVLRRVITDGRLSRARNRPLISATTGSAV